MEKHCGPGPDRSLDLQGEEARARLMQLFRYAEVGRCVNGITHDINNDLGVIMAYAELVLLSGQLAEDERRMLTDVLEAVSKCSRLISGITVVARKEKPSVNMVDPGRLVATALELRNYVLRASRIEVELQIEANLPSIVCDTPKLQLAIMYLLLNAQEALEDSDASPRVLRVGIRNCAEGVEIEVWNNGSPVPEDFRESMFTPLTTTKPAPHLGLGLFMARGIAEQHDGSLTYDPERGFVLYVRRENQQMAQV